MWGDQSVVVGDVVQEIVHFTPEAAQGVAFIVSWRLVGHWIRLSTAPFLPSRSGNTLQTWHNIIVVTLFLQSWIGKKKDLMTQNFLEIGGCNGKRGFKYHFGAKIERDNLWRGNTTFSPWLLSYQMLPHKTPYLKGDTLSDAPDDCLLRDLVSAPPPVFPPAPDVFLFRRSDVHDVLNETGLAELSREEGGTMVEISGHEVFRADEESPLDFNEPKPLETNKCAQ